MKKQASGGAGTEGGGAANENEQDTSTEHDQGNQDDGNDDGKEADSSGNGSKADARGRERFAKDLGKYKDENRALKQKLKEIEENKLKDENRWKELAEQREREREEALEARATSESTFKTTIKQSKIEQYAIKAGIREEALDDLERLDFDEVEVEATDSGRYIVRGADKAIEKLKKAKPYLFKDATAPKFNGGGGRASGGDKPLTADEVARLEAKHGRNSPIFINAWNNWQKSKQKKSS